MANLAALVARKGMVLLRTVLLVGAVALASTVVVAIAADDTAIVKAVDEYITVCQTQYSKGLYSTAKDGLLSAKSEYSSNMTDAQAKKIDSLLAELDEALTARESVAGMLQAGSEAIANGDYMMASSLLSKVVANKYASAAQVEEAKAKLASSKEQLEKVEEQVKTLFNQSYELYKAGNFDEALAGFKKVEASGVDVSKAFGRDSSYFIAKIADDKAKAEAKAMEAEAKKLAKAKAKAEAEAKAMEAEKLAAEQAKAEAEAKAIAEAKAKAEAEAKAMEAEKLAAEQAKAEAEAKAIAKAKAKAEAEAKAMEAEKLAAEQAKAEAEAKAIAEAKAKVEAEKNAQMMAIQKAQAEAEAAKIAEQKALEQAQIAKEEEMKALFKESIMQYKAGNFDQAGEGFEVVKDSGVSVSYWGKDSSYYIAKIEDDKLAAQTASEEKPAPVVAKATEPVAPKPSEAKTVEEAIVAQKTAPEAQEDSYLKVLDTKRNQQRDYTRAIVSDSISKANGYLATNEYAKARGALAVAYSNIEKTKLLLGDDLYNSYKTNLDQLTANIDRMDQQMQIEAAKIKRTQTEQLEEEIRTNMERQRQQAVKDYMANAMAFQREQRYKEALAQLDALLAIDPLNSMALLQKQTLEQTITWREQIEIQKKFHEQEIQVLLGADRAAIPYSDDMTFPSNWKEIVDKRKKRSTNASSKEDLDVYRLLEQVVDLSAFYEDMPFGEAITVLQNSTNPPLTIIVLWRDLDENAFIDQTTPINLTIPAPVKVKTALDLLLESVAGGLAELGYVVKDGIIQIATMESLPDKMVTERYDVRELLGEASSYSFEMDASNYGQSEGRQAGGGGSSSDDNRNNDDNNDQNNDMQSIMGRATNRAQEIVTLIQESIDPESWYDAGGDGTVSVFQNNVLVIRQTLENHEKISKLIDELRLTLGEQVAIEARFITVTENFLEQIGVDLDMVISPQDTNWNDVSFIQNHSASGASDTGVPGSLSGTIASTLNGSYVMDDLQVSFLIEATQAHSDTKNLNAPKVAVLNGERASIRVGQQISYISDYDFETITSGGDSELVTSIADPEIDKIRDGVNLTVTPTITADKKYVILGIETEYMKTSFDTYSVPSDADNGGGGSYNIQLPVRSEAKIGTRITVPDGGTLLIGGQKLTGEVTNEQGVPVLSKLPFIGPLFENRGTARDHSILLILVKPTIILRDEQEREAIDAMDNGF